MSDSQGTKSLLIDKAPTACLKCQKPLCLRKQVINLALGNSDEMYCLVCLAVMNEQEPKEILLKVKSYVQGRECLQKEWVKYENSEYCPDKTGCFMRECFAD
jgi:hypothetical protein